MKSHLIACALLLGSATLAHAQQQPPAPQTREQRVAELVKKLGDPSFDVRESAQRQLEALGAAALPALDQAARSDDPEVASRATEAASRIRGGQPAPDAPGSRPRPTEVEPQAPPVVPLPGGPQDMDEVLRELQKQLERDLPEGMGEGMGNLFREMFGERPGQPGQPGEQPGVRVWTWRSGEQQLPTTESSPLARLGIVTGPATPALRAQLGIAPDEGVVVEQVRPGSWAAACGIERYDVLVGIDGRSVRNPRDLSPMLQKETTIDLYRRAVQQRKTVPAPGPQTSIPPREAPPAPPTPPAPGGQREQRSF